MANTKPDNGLRMAKLRTTERERQAFVDLWKHGVPCDKIREVLPRMASFDDKRLRARAATYGLPFYREGEAGTNIGVVNEDLLRELLKKPRRV